MPRPLLLALTGAFVLLPIDTASAQSLRTANPEKLGALQARYANPANRFEYAEIARELEEVLRAAPEAHAARLLRIAALIKAGERRAAGLEMKQVAAARDRLDEVQHTELRVLAANLAGKPLEEIRFLNELAAHRPDDRWLHYELARAHAELGEYGAAVQHVRRALELGGPNARWEGSWVHALHSRAIFRSGGNP